MHVVASVYIDCCLYPNLIVDNAHMAHMRGGGQLSLGEAGKESIKYRTNLNTY